VSHPALAGGPPTLRTPAGRRDLRHREHQGNDRGNAPARHHGPVVVVVVPTVVVVSPQKYGCPQMHGSSASDRRTQYSPLTLMQTPWQFQDGHATF